MEHKGIWVWHKKGVWRRHKKGVWHEKEARARHTKEKHRGRESPQNNREAPTNRQWAGGGAPSLQPSARCPAAAPPPGPTRPHSRCSRGRNPSARNSRHCARLRCQKAPPLFVCVGGATTSPYKSYPHSVPVHINMFCHAKRHFWKLMSAAPFLGFASIRKHATAYCYTPPLPRRPSASRGRWPTGFARFRAPHAARRFSH